MTRRRWLRAVFLFLPALAGALVPVPALVRRVIDQTGTLSPAQQNALESALAALESEKGAQVAVLIVPTTQPEAIEQFGLRVAETWKLGRKGVDDGVLLLVAKDDRTLRIEVGYGLEGALPDAVCKQIVDDFIVPRFRAGDFHGGIETGVGLIARRVRGEPLPAPASPRRAPVTEEKLKGLFIFWIVVFGIATAVFGKKWGPVLAACGVGVVGAVLLALFLGVIAALAALVFGLLVANSDSGRGGWSSGGRGGGWHGGGGGFGGGGGGFSGGGGGFGGGGASGRW